MPLSRFIVIYAKSIYPRPKTPCHTATVFRLATQLADEQGVAGWSLSGFYWGDPVGRWWWVVATVAAHAFLKHLSSQTPMAPVGRLAGIV